MHTRSVLPVQLYVLSGYRVLDIIGSYSVQIRIISTSVKSKFRSFCYYHGSTVVPGSTINLKNLFYRELLNLVHLRPRDRGIYRTAVDLQL
eukprot:SAG11_NODE_3064_length_2717_cov_1.713140_2_plen_91_part_00